MNVSLRLFVVLVVTLTVSWCLFVVYTLSGATMGGLPNLMSGFFGAFLGAGIAIWWAWRERKRIDTRKRQAVATALIREAEQVVLRLDELRNEDHPRPSGDYRMPHHKRFGDFVELFDAPTVSAVNDLFGYLEDVEQTAKAVPRSGFYMPGEDEINARLQRELEERRAAFTDAIEVATKLCLFEIRQLEQQGGERGHIPLTMPKEGVQAGVRDIRERYIPSKNQPHASVRQ